MISPLPVKSVATLTEADLDSELARMYSRFKFGALDAIEFFSSALTKLIQADQAARAGTWQMTHVPTQMQESGIHFLTELLAHEFHLPSFELIKVISSYWYHAKLKVERQRLATGSFQYRGPALTNETVALLDDVCVTGTILTECMRVLIAAGAGSVQPYTLINLNAVDPRNEAYLNLAAYRHGGLNEIITIFNDPTTQPTNFWLAFFTQLSPTQLKMARSQLKSKAQDWIQSKLMAFPQTPVVEAIMARGWIREEATG